MKLIFALALVLCFFSAPVLAQQDDNPFLLKRGDNEFGFWGGLLAESDDDLRRSA